MPTSVPYTKTPCLYLYYDEAKEPMTHVQTDAESYHGKAMARGTPWAQAKAPDNEAFLPLLAPQTSKERYIGGFLVPFDMARSKPNT